tara:strand:- start:23 stop:370 length:348 start_codon:yes stop_codon:yes gene_type:complete
MKVIDHFINVERKPIISVHDSFICSVIDIKTLKLLINDGNNELFKNINDISIPKTLRAGAVEGVVGLKGIKATNVELSSRLSEAICNWFEGETDGMNGKFWDKLMTMDTVQEPPS